MKTLLSKYLILGYLLCTAYWVHSQIPTRIIVNPGFEFPLTGCSPANYNFIPHNNVNGWRTLDSASTGTVNCGSSGSGAPFLIELWTTGFLGRDAHSGNQLAEINGNNATFLYQEICLMANEVVPFSVWHLRRDGSGTGEQMVAELKTTDNINISTAYPDTAKGAWTNYTGTLTNNGSAGIRRYGFRAISGGSLGNLIDDVSIALRPLADIKSFEDSLIYETDSNTLNIYVNGTLNGTATVSIGKSGTASYNQDYIIGNSSRGMVNTDGNGNITLTLPPGDYDPNKSTGSTTGLITIPFQIIDDGIYEPNESLTYTITGSANGGNGNSALDLSIGINGQSAACGTVVGSSGFAIIDIIALPVKLISFTAEKRVGSNLIQWQVAEESNIDKYILEYSNNGTDFKLVAEINYNPATYLNYNFLHYTQNYPSTYYRLKSIDKNGNASSLGNTISLSESINNNFSVFPNPGNGIFTANLFSSNNTSVEFTISDIFGKEINTISSKVIAGSNAIPLALDHLLENGIYYITCSGKNISRTIKVVIFK